MKRFFLGSAAAAAIFSGVFAQYSMSLGGEPKYKDGFKNFDYVNPDAPKGGVVRLSAEGSYNSLNPFLLGVVPAAGTLYLYETLMTQSADEPFTNYGLIADDMKIVDDGFGVIFHINPKAKFQDGTKITAKDVKFSMETMKKYNVFYARYWGEVKDTQILDDENVKFVLASNENRELPMILGQLYVLPEHIFMQNGKNTFPDSSTKVISGSGPYKIEKYDFGKQISFVRDKNYWGNDLPVSRGFYNFDRMNFDYYKDDTVELKAFLKGDYDVRFENSARRWVREYTGKAVDKGLIVKKTIPHHNPSGMNGIWFNTRHAIFKDIRVREALLYAFDGEWVNRNLYYSQYTRIQSHFGNSELAMTPKASDFDRQILKPVEKDVEKYYPGFFEKEFALPRTDGKNVVGENQRQNLIYAAKLLKEAGYEIKDGVMTHKKTGQKLEFSLLLTTNSYEKVVQFYKRTLEQIGVKMLLRVYDPTRYIAARKAYDYDAIITGLGQSLSPGNEQANYFGSADRDQPGGRNYAGTGDPVLDMLTARINNVKDREELVNMTRTLDRVLMFGYYVIPFHTNSVSRVAMWDFFKMPEITPITGAVFDTWWVDAAAQKKILKERKN